MMSSKFGRRIEKDVTFCFSMLAEAGIEDIPYNDLGRGEYTNAQIVLAFENKYELANALMGLPKTTSEERRGILCKLVFERKNRKK